MRVYVYVLKLALSAGCNAYHSIQKLVWSPECVKHISHHIPNKSEEFQHGSPLLPDWCFFYNRELATNMSPVKFKNSATSPITTPISSVSTRRCSKSSIVHLFKPSVRLRDGQWHQIYSDRDRTGKDESCKLSGAFKHCKHSPNKLDKTKIPLNNSSSCCWSKLLFQAFELRGKWELIISCSIRITNFLSNSVANLVLPGYTLELNL